MKTEYLTARRALCLAFALASTLTPSLSHAAPFAKGADVSWVTEMEASGVKFYTKTGAQQDLFQILKGYTIDSIRLRVWVNPSGGWSGKTDVINKAVRAKNAGMRVMVDFHYSDSWADPGKQYKPAAWSSHGISQLNTDVYNHTTDVLNGLKAAGVTPEWVQVGNETDDGMLWEDGRASTHIANFASLITSGYNAVKAVFPSAKVIVHISRGYDNARFRSMFDRLTANNAKFDVIGISLYPSSSNWSTLNSQCYANMNDMVARYGKDVMICEVGMDYTAAQACKDMLIDLMNKTKAVTGGHGLGVFYWEPETYNWGYNKGAWGTDGRPTIAMDAFLYDVSAGSGNLVTNGGFETGGATQTPSGWTTWASTGNSDADKTEAGGHSGSYRLTHWKSSAYSVSTYQIKTGLANGTYTLRAWVKSGGGQTTCQLYAKNFGGTEKDFTLPTTSTWTQITISGISVTNGQCEIGLYSVAGAGQWCNMDDVEFFKN